MFTSETPDEKTFAIKPMNCPGCVQVFNQGLKSYRDLPLKLSEFGKVQIRTLWSFTRSIKSKSVYPR